MSLGEGRDRWVDRWLHHNSPPRPPSEWIVGVASEITPRGIAADLAGGDGRHAKALSDLGHRTVLVDFAEIALRVAPPIPRVVADMWALPFKKQSLSLICIVNFLERDLFRALIDLLEPGGYLVYETYTRDNLRLVAEGRVRAPRSPEYTLEEGELLSLVSPLRVLQSREGLVSDAAGERCVASVLAQKS